MFGSVVLISLFLHFQIAQESQDLAHSGFTTQVLIFALKVAEALSVTVYFCSVVRVTPTLTVGTAFAITSLLSRSASVLAPYVAEQAGDPIITITITSLMALFATYFLRDDTKED